MFKAAPAVLAVSLLAGCSENRPSDKVAGPVVRQQAETDLLEGLEIVDFQRSNGQVDPVSAYRYKVTYTYRLRLARPFGEVVLATARPLSEELHQAMAGAARADGDWDALQQSTRLMRFSMAASQWVANQGDGFDARRDALLAACEPCRAFWESADDPGRAELRRIAFINVWSYLEDKQFQDGAQVGDSVERYAWHYFEKTEKGWLPAS